MVANEEVFNEAENGTFKARLRVKGNLKSALGVRA